MKIKILTFLALCLLGLQSRAQYLVNGSFEDSTIISNDTVPTGWSMDPLGSMLTTDAHGGDKAVSIWNWYAYVEGWLIYGAVANSYATNGGHPVSINPDHLTGYYKYILGQNGGAMDSAVVEIMVVSHQNFVGSRDTLAYEQYKLGPQAAYEAFSLPINYRTSGIPADSILIRFFSSENGFCNPAMECDYLFLDDLELSGATAVLPVSLLGPRVALVPSPSTDGFVLQVEEAAAFPVEVELFDLRGQRVWAGSWQSPTALRHDPGLAAGSYIWRAKLADGRQATGKWIAR